MKTFEDNKKLFVILNFIKMSLALHHIIKNQT